MSNKSARVQNVQTPGAPSQEFDPAAPKGSEANPLTDGDAAADLAGEPRPQATAGEDVAFDDLPPDVQRLIDQRVAQALQQQRRTEARAKINPATGRNDLPTQEEARARVMADPKRRAVLSRDGWVTAPAPVKERDESGFAKA